MNLFINIFVKIFSVVVMVVSVSLLWHFTHEIHLFLASLGIVLAIVITSVYWLFYFLDKNKSLIKWPTIESAEKFFEKHS